MSVIRRRWHFTGNVQGVGFRYFAQCAAQKLGLTGWVANNWDGSVTLEAQGERAALDELVPMIERSLPDYHEQAPGDRSRVQEVLRIMLTAWRSAQLQEDAQRMLRALPKSPSIL